MKIKLETNQRFMAFEDCNMGAISFFDKLTKAKAWARKQRRNNKRLLTPCEKEYLAENSENIIFIDIVEMDKKGQYEVVEIIWDCPLF